MHTLNPDDYTVEKDDPHKANGGGDIQAKGYPFTTYKETGTGLASKNWIFKGLLAQGETSGWVGPPGSLKSAILTSLCPPAASGQDWCGKRNKGACAVIYFALERAALVKRRLRAYAERDGLDLPIAVVAKTINLMDEKVVDEIVATIDEVERHWGIKVGLIIFDTLPKAIAAGGGDEDKARDQGKVYANIQRVKEQRNVHVALICHPGKNISRGPRGSNASTGDFDVQIEITGDVLRTATVTKNNDGPLGEIATFQSRLHDFGKDEDGDPIGIWLAEPVAGAPGVSSTKAKAKNWSKALRPFHDVLIRVIDDQGKDLHPFADGPHVRAADKEAVRAEFYRIHLADGETPEKKQAAKRQALNRAIKNAQADHLIAVREIEDIQYIWLT